MHGGSPTSAMHKLPEPPQFIAFSHGPLAQLLFDHNRSACSAVLPMKARTGSRLCRSVSLFLPQAGRSWLRPKQRIRPPGFLRSEERVS